jgi:hypothetical protein
MDDAREVIAATLLKFKAEAKNDTASGYADAILAALSARGLVVVPREPSEAMIDAPRPLVLFYGPPKANFTLGQHIDSGVRKVRLTDEERGMNYINKATLAALIYRAMLDAAVNATNPRAEAVNAKET